MNSDTGAMKDFGPTLAELAKLNPEAVEKDLSERLMIEAKSQGFDVMFTLGDEVEFHGQTLVLTYVNVGKRRLTFMPKKSLEQGFKP